MRIAFDSEIFYLQKAGGISVHFCNIIINLLALNKSDIFILVNNSKLIECKKNESFRRLFNLNKIYFVYYYNIFDLKFKLRKHKIDIIHSTYYNFLNNLLGEKIVYTFHDAAPERFLFDYIYRLYFLKIIVRFFCFIFSSGISFISTFSLKEFKYFYRIIHKLFPKKKYIISGNDICFENPIVSNGSNLYFQKQISVTYIGMRGYYKNFISLIKALKLFSNNKDKMIIKLDIVGGGSLNLFEEKLLKDNNIKYFYHENVNNTELNQILIKTNLFLHPSFYEGFGITVLEAMSLKVPILAIDIPPVREVARDSIFYAKNSSSEAIFEAIIDFYKTPKFSLIKKVNDAYLISKKFSWENVAIKHLDLYSNIIKN